MTPWETTFKLLVFLDEQLGEYVSIEKACIKASLPSSWRFSRWYFKNEFTVGFNDIYSECLFFQHNETNRYVFKGYRTTTDSEIKSLIRAIANPNLFPLCINMDWAIPMIDAVYKPLESKEP